MKWVTLKRVKMDRTLCAWLILRFLDPEAEFEFVEKDEMDKALQTGARSFHDYVFAGVPREHSGFQQLLIEQGLDKTNQALVLMGESVRSAERAGWRKDGTENQGLWAIANGMSALSKSDADMVERMLPVYDALYAYGLQRAEGDAGWKADA